MMQARLRPCRVFEELELVVNWDESAQSAMPGNARAEEASEAIHEIGDRGRNGVGTRLTYSVGIIKVRIVTVSSVPCTGDSNSHHTSLPGAIHNSDPSIPKLIHNFSYGKWLQWRSLSRDRHSHGAPRSARPSTT